ncbi:hypothetical protein DFH06DRAFT_1211774 [Mycena polygramma]|nr:hypothetical protein DFH06DRAFT_1211774 [Mycena polygramma]
MTTLTQKWLNILGACHQAYVNQRLEAPLYGVYTLILSEYLQGCTLAKSSIYLNPQHTLLPSAVGDSAQMPDIRRRTPDFTGVIAPVDVNSKLTEFTPLSPGMLETLALVFGAEVKPLRSHSQNVKFVSWDNTGANITRISKEMIKHFGQLHEQAAVGFDLKKIKEKNSLFIFLLVGVFFTLHRFTLEPPAPVEAAPVKAGSDVNDSQNVTPPAKRRRLITPPPPPPSVNHGGLVLKRTLVVSTARIFGTDSFDSYSEPFKYALNLCAAESGLVYSGAEFASVSPPDEAQLATEVEAFNEIWKAELAAKEYEEVFEEPSPATTTAGSPYVGRTSYGLDTTPAQTRMKTMAKAKAKKLNLSAAVDDEGNSSSDESESSSNGDDNSSA